ncbi:MAG: diacylglycerol kinase family protein [Thermomicrobiales bacterium]
MESDHHHPGTPEFRLESGDRVLVIANPATRQNARRLIKSLTKAAPDGIDLDIQLTSQPGEARKIADARLSGAKLLVAIGGDGTVGDCAHALIDSDIPLAVIPGGSTNIIAREQGVPLGARAASRIIFGKNQLRRIDAGMCDDRIFLHMAGAGFDARFFSLASPSLKKRLGWFAYLPAAMKAMQHLPSRYSIDVDGEIIDVNSPLILIANGPSVIHPLLRIHPDIQDNDGYLDVLIITATRPMELARTIGSLGTMRLARSPFVMHRRARTIQIDSDDAVPVEVDGDVFGETPRTFSILPGAINIIVPID